MRLWTHLAVNKLFSKCRASNPDQDALVRVLSPSSVSLLSVKYKTFNLFHLFLINSLTASFLRPFYERDNIVRYFQSHFLSIRTPLQLMLLFWKQNSDINYHCACTIHSIDQSPRQVLYSNRFVINLCLTDSDLVSLSNRWGSSLPKSKLKLVNLWRFNSQTLATID